MKKLNVSKLGMALAVVVALFAFSLSAEAKKKKIIVDPSDARIFVNGGEVGKGEYDINFTSKEDIALLEFRLEGYEPLKVRLYKNNPKSTLIYKLNEDGSWKNSVGASEGVDYANRGFDVIVRKGMNGNEVWKRLMNIATNNFEDVEIRDKSAGWIRTAWTVTRFGYYTVRTRLEVKVQFLGDDEVAFRATLYSQRAETEQGISDNNFYKWDRVLMKYNEVIKELRTTLGSNL